MLKKVFAATLAGLFITAPAFANIENYGADKEAYENSADFVGVKMGGSFFIKGNTKDINGKDYGYYESDFEVKTNFVVSETTSATLVFEAFDENWEDDATSGQNEFEVTKATMNHTFGTGTTFVGGIAGNQDSWGTAFGENQDRGYFVQLDQALPFGTLTLKNEKMDEGKQDKKDDKDGYLVGLTTKAGGVTFQPAVYVVKNEADSKKDLDRLILAATGNVGAIALETEFGYNDGDAGSVFGAWVDAGTTVGSLSLNASVFYSGVDKDFTFNDGNNVCPMEILSDDINLNGATLFRVKAAKSITDKVSVDASVAYAFNNLDDDEQITKATKDDVDADKKIAMGDDLATGANFDTAWEMDVNVSYKASDAVTLSCGVAYLDGDNIKGINAKHAALNEARTDAYAKIFVAF